MSQQVSVPSMEDFSNPSGKRGFWGRFVPVNFPEKDWIQEGLSRGIPG